MPLQGNVSGNLTVVTPVQTLGQFSPNSLCFSDVTQQQTYYIYLVSIKCVGVGVC